ncbi:MAG: alpha/beta hydrolase [Microbacteriaceae bacterium]
MRVSTRVVAIASIVAVTSMLGGCFSLPGLFGGATTSTPTGENVSVDLEQYYGQILTWSSCGNGMQCATATAPLDWEDPARESIELALVRQIATGGTSLGSLLVNPGGPGASGYDIVKDSVDFATTETLQRSFDIVGFDPRGVGRSSSVSCHDDASDLDAFLYDITPGEIGSEQWLGEVAESNTRFAAQCSELTGDLLGEVDTISAARDLDMLRAALGDEKLNYLGYSYGTYLGATFADLFPSKTGRLVLDGALDPATSSFDVTAIQAEGFESAMLAFLEDCDTRATCPFTDGPAEAQKEIRSILDRLDVSPLRNIDGRKLGSNTMTAAIILPLYDASNWPYLIDLFTSVVQGDAELAFLLADSYNSRGEDGIYLDNSLESRIAINCLDYPRESDPTVWRDEAAQLAELAPIFGPQFAWGETSCANWPYPAGRARAPIVAAGSNDILVVGTTNDPATPYVWSVALAEQLEKGHLVTREGEGHTGYNKGNSCVDETVDNYFVSGTVPTTDPLC